MTGVFDIIFYNVFSETLRSKVFNIALDGGVASLKEAFDIALTHNQKTGERITIVKMSEAFEMMNGLPQKRGIKLTWTYYYVLKGNLYKVIDKGSLDEKIDTPK